MDDKESHWLTPTQKKTIEPVFFVLQKKKMNARPFSVKLANSNFSTIQKLPFFLFSPSFFFLLHMAVQFPHKNQTNPKNLIPPSCSVDCLIFSKIDQVRGSKTFMTTTAGKKKGGIRNNSGAIYQGSNWNHSYQKRRIDNYLIPTCHQFVSR